MQQQEAWVLWVVSSRPLFLDTVSISPHFCGQPSLIPVQLPAIRMNLHLPSRLFTFHSPLPSGYTNGLWLVFSSSLGYQLSRAMATFTTVIFPGPASVTHLEIVEPRWPSSLEPQKQWATETTHPHPCTPHHQACRPREWLPIHNSSVRSHTLPLALRNSNE